MVRLEAPERGEKVSGHERESSIFGFSRLSVLDMDAFLQAVCSMVSEVAHLNPKP